MNTLLKVKTKTSETIVTEEAILYKPNTLSGEIKKIPLSGILTSEVKGIQNLLISDGSSVYDIHFGEHTQETNRFLNKEISLSEFKQQILKTKIMVYVWGVVVIIGLILFGSWLFGGDNGSTKSVNNPPQAIVSQSQLYSIQSSLVGWAEGRWDDWTADIDAEGNLLVRVYANSYSNQVAIDNYCDVLKMEANNAGIPQSQRGLFIYQAGSIIKSCL